MLGPTLETERLILRPPIQDDFDAWAAMHAEEETMRFIGGVVPRDVAWRGMAAGAGSWALMGFGMFSVIERESGKWLGRLEPLRPGGETAGWPGWEVGWGLIRSAQGKGYAREGATAAMDFAVDTLGWTDIIHTIDPANTPSQKLAIALGSRNRGPGKLPPPFEDANVEIWGQTADEWRAQRRNLGR
jgi:RimJ/RimL family protein N-acetyltransferase